MMSVAKALSSGYQPIGATLLATGVAQVIEAEASRLGVLGHGFTYAGHPVTSAVALETLRIYDEIDLPRRVRALAPAFGAHLQTLADHPLVGHSRSIGLIGAIELVADRAARQHFPPEQAVGARLIALALEQGLILRNLGDTIAICPPLIITPEELDSLFARLGLALGELSTELAAANTKEPA